MLFAAVHESVDGSGKTRRVAGGEIDFDQRGLSVFVQ
jgi:hypothetical protein